MAVLNACRVHRFAIWRAFSWLYFDEWVTQQSVSYLQGRQSHGPQGTINQL
jgi:hypothetical protein